MVRARQHNTAPLYECEECGFQYQEREWAQKCQAWCKEHQSCNLEIIEHAQLFPVIKPNHRNTNDLKIIAEREAKFREVEPIYRLRRMVEIQFAWEDTYRKLVIRYEKKQVIARGWRLLAASMANFRECFGRET